MSEYAELPWSVEDTIENLKELKEVLQERCIIQNLHGRGEKDAEEVAFDFDRAIKALEEVQKYRQIGVTDPDELEQDLLLCKADRELFRQYSKIGTVEECRAAVEKQKPKKVIKCGDGTEHCPTCDCDNSCIGYGVCIDCGQKLDWRLENETD